MGDFVFKVPSNEIPTISSKRIKLDKDALADAENDQEEEFKSLNRQSISHILRKIEGEIAVNLEEREKFSDEPLKYMESEADLAQGCKELTTLSQVSAGFLLCDDRCEHCRELNLSMVIWK